MVQYLLKPFYFSTETSKVLVLSTQYSFWVQIERNSWSCDVLKKLAAKEKGFIKAKSPTQVTQLKMH